MDRYRIKPIIDYFGEMKLSEISTFLIEKYRLERLRTPIVYNGKKRCGGRETWEKPRSGTAWRTACRLAEIKNLRIHDLRQTFGTRAADAGVPLAAIRDVMGHNSIKMTERYAHATDDGMRRAVEAASNKRAVVVKMASEKVASR